jgi:hypothetical protein
LKPVAWRKKSPDFNPEQPAKQIVDRSMLLNHSGSKKAEWSRTDSGISYQLSKSKASLSSRVASKQLDEYRENTSGCQHYKQEIFMISTSAGLGL